MHQPRPHGQLAVGGAATEADAAAIELLARRLTNLRQLSGVDSLRMVRTLPDGGYVIAQDMGGVFKTITHKPAPPEQPEPFDGVATDYLPMLFSGTVTKAVLRGGEGLGLLLTEQTRRRIAGYRPEDLPPKEVQLQRFVIRYNPLVFEFEPTFPTEAIFTQYTSQRPTWYSGAMAEVMQVVGGYGRQDLGELPRDGVERARMSVPEAVRKAISGQIGNVRLPGYTGLPARNGQFQYDYKFNNTNGVAFDHGGKPWLLRIHTSGVWAMPLPLIPASTTIAFRVWMEDEGDQEVIAILDRFGGLPSGEAFPLTGKTFEAWRRAGVIIRVCDTADFYDHIAYSSACGWSFNSRGTEGYNTCYDYYDDEGLGYGLGYKLSLSLGQAEHDGKLPPLIKPEDPDDARLVDAYLGSLYRQMSDSKPEHLAIKYKLRRVNPADILARADLSNQANELNYWDALELPPIATHFGSVREVSRGYLYHGAKFEFQPQIKFPEPWQGGCVSHDFLPLINGRGKAKYPNSDAIMFGYYVDDELKVVKYFREGGSFTREVENDYDECMIVGSWTQTETTGSSTLVGHFYTSDLDDRKEMAPVTTVTTIEGIDRGYDSKPMFGFDHIFSSVGSLWRNRYFTHLTKTNRGEGHSLAVAVCIPYLNRNSVIYAKREGTSGERYTESLSLYAVYDPNNYRIYTYDFVFAWVGGSYSGNVATAGSATPAPKDGNPVWVMGYNYDPYPCSDFADQGDWIGELPVDVTWLVHPSRHQWNNSGGGGGPKVNTYSKVQEKPGKSSGELHYSFRTNPDLVHKRIPDTGYFLGSPDQFLGVFYRDGTRIVIGESSYGNVSESVTGEPGSLRKFWGHSTLADSKSAHHFIGVINE